MTEAPPDTKATIPIVAHAHNIVTSYTISRQKYSPPPRDGLYSGQFVLGGAALDDCVTDYEQETEGEKSATSDCGFGGETEEAGVG